MIYPEEIREKYNECMYDEREVLEKFLYTTYDIRDGVVRDVWFFQNPVEVLSVNGMEITLNYMKTDPNKFVIFGGHPKSTLLLDDEYECSDFAYGELSKVIEALPDADEFVKNQARKDIEKLCGDGRVCLGENIFHVEINGKMYNVCAVEYIKGRVVCYNKEGKIVSDEYDAEFLTELRDFMRSDALRNSSQFKVMWRILTHQCDNATFKPASQEKITFTIGSQCTIQVTSVFIESGKITIDGIDLDREENQNYVILREAAIETKYLDAILDCINEHMWEEVMNYSNSHDEELVRKINEAWNNKDYHDKFGDILLAIGRRDKKEIAEKLDCEIDNYETAMANAYEILQHICNDQDLETILLFIRYKE